MLMIVRHAEKPTASNGQRGLTPTGEHDKHSLSVRGWTRAGALVGMFAPRHSEPAAGLRRPDAIYASGHAGDSSRRPVQTVMPLAEWLGQDIHHHLGAGDEAALAASLTARSGVTLVAWQHEAIPKLVQCLGTVVPTAPEKWPDDRFDIVWTLVRTESCWQFAQVPQLVLAGDRPDPIAG